LPLALPYRYQLTSLDPGGKSCRVADVTAKLRALYSPAPGARAHAGDAPAVDAAEERGVLQRPALPRPPEDPQHVGRVGNPLPAAGARGAIRGAATGCRAACIAGTVWPGLGTRTAAHYGPFARKQLLYRSGDPDPIRPASLPSEARLHRASPMPVCPSCGQVNPEVARFCLACGTPLAAAHPPGVERRIVTVIFVDLVGFTAARAERLDPEEVQAVLAPYPRPRAAGDRIVREASSRSSSAMRSWASSAQRLRMATTRSARVRAALVRAGLGR